MLGAGTPLERERGVMGCGRATRLRRSARYTTHASMPGSPLLKKDQPRAQSFDFSEEVRQSLRALAEGMGVSQVAVLELAIRHLRHGAAAVARRAVPAPRDASTRTGSPHSFRLSAQGRRLLDELAEHDPPLAESQVAVVELAIRRFAKLAEREGLILGHPA